MNILLQSYQAGLFAKKFWPANLMAGILVGVIALPLAMAFAIASGAKPEQGIYTAIIAGLMVSILGGSRSQIAGPTGAFIAVLSTITAKYGIDGLQMATMLAGFLLFLFGILRLGSIIKFIPEPVILGFTAGIAIVIWVGQWPYFFGLTNIQGTHFHEKLWQTIQQLPSFDTTTTLLALTSLMLVIYAKRIPTIQKIPGPVIALLLMTGLQALCHFQNVATIGSVFGGIPQGLPPLHLPEIHLNRLLELIGSAFTIALLGAIESLLSAVVADNMANTQHDSNQELIGQGLANIITPLFGGFAATGAIARTATNIRSGGNSPLAGIIHSLTLLFILIFLAPLAVHIPLATLAAILFVIAWNMSDAYHVTQIIKRAPLSDVVILLVTFFLTIFVDLVVAVNAGVFLAIVRSLLGKRKSAKLG